jgi:hypothetical protein
VQNQGDALKSLEGKGLKRKVGRQRFQFFLPCNPDVTPVPKPPEGGDGGGRNGGSLRGMELAGSLRIDMTVHENDPHHFVKAWAFVVLDPATHWTEQLWWEARESFELNLSITRLPVYTLINCL